MKKYLFCLMACTLLISCEEQKEFTYNKSVSVKCGETIADALSLSYGGETLNIQDLDWESADSFIVLKDETKQPVAKHLGETELTMRHSSGQIGYVKITVESNLPATFEQLAPYIHNKSLENTAKHTLLEHYGNPTKEIEDVIIYGNLSKDYFCHAYFYDLSESIPYQSAVAIATYIDKAYYEARDFNIHSFLTERYEYDSKLGYYYDAYNLNDAKVACIYESGSLEDEYGIEKEIISIEYISAKDVL